MKLAHPGYQTHKVKKEMDTTAKLDIGLAIQKAVRGIPQEQDWDSTRYLLALAEKTLQELHLRELNVMKTKALELTLTPLTTAVVYQTEVALTTKARDLGDEKEKCLQVLSNLGIKVNQGGFWSVDQGYAFLRLSRIS